MPIAEYIVSRISSYLFIHIVATFCILKTNYVGVCFCKAPL